MSVRLSPINTGSEPEPEGETPMAASKQVTVKRRNPIARALRAPAFRARTERERGGYVRKDKHPSKLEG